MCNGPKTIGSISQPNTWLGKRRLVPASAVSTAWGKAGTASVKHEMKSSSAVSHY